MGSGPRLRCEEYPFLRRSWLVVKRARPRGRLPFLEKKEVRGPQGRRSKPTRNSLVSSEPLQSLQISSQSTGKRSLSLAREK